MNLEIKEGVNESNVKRTTNLKGELLSEKEIELHKARKVHNPLYPKLPENITASTLIGFRKRVSNFIAKEQYNNQNNPAY